MDFRFTEEDERFRQEVREFINKELPPDWTGTGLLQEAKDGPEWEFSRGMLRKLGAKGWHSLSWPKVSHNGRVPSGVPSVTQSPRSGPPVTWKKSLSLIVTDLT